MNISKLVYYSLYLRELLTFPAREDDAQGVFTRYYKNNFWSGKESLSGRGSSVVSTKHLRSELALILRRHNIESMLDIPCGDYNWMKLVERQGIFYTGADVVREMISENNRKYKSNDTNFLVLDITKDSLPKVDLVFTRDCLVHFSYRDILKAIKQIKESGSTYLLTTSFPNWPKNLNIKTGHWQPVNLSLPPFNFPKPVETVLESEKKTGVFNDKSLNLYLVKNLPDSTVR